MNAALFDFPESEFTCESTGRADYEGRVELGRDRMRGRRAVFCGLARDVRDSLPSISARIECAGAMFQDYRVVIYENDSRDGTLGYLWAWQQENPRVTVLSDFVESPRWGQVCDAARMVQMADCRNRYLAHVLEHFAEFDDVVVLDTDLPAGFSYDGLANTFGYTRWDVMASNGLLFDSYGGLARRPIFFDAWAFRREGETEAQNFDVVNRLLFRRGDPLVPVWSCFGGLAVYRMEGLRSGVRYGGEDCEHVVLHRQLRERGFGRQYLNPNQIVLYSVQT
jgi:hypothetical protein